MNINLRDITEENWIKCISLTTNTDGSNTVFEEFVASNAVSIAQSKIQDGWITKAIYDEDTIVGFTMYGYANDLEIYEICRLMIDYNYQQRGYGTQALLKVIDEMKSWNDCNEIFLSFESNNIVAKKLYEKIGFKDTGKIVEGEILYKLILE
ncbi:GNAT family N-acetyltransferase [Rummeliibacillus sp. NPDC094406]|uniref:GNAT family N-acetyltransferase n=1 Tax=Rummeliibacillus sp. NPDC094406 TaxID=3364511 RepID=UPI0037FF9BD7